MQDVMLDIETLGRKSNAVVLSVGAIFFDKERLGGEFYRVLDTPTQVEVGRTTNAETIDWWSKQEKAAQDAVFAVTPTDTRQALEEFIEWIARQPVNMWGNGADFDCVIFGSLFEDFGLKKPWGYGDNRCFRTLKNLCIPFGSHELPHRHGTQHNALDDAVYQARMAQRFLKGRLI